MQTAELNKVGRGHGRARGWHCLVLVISGLCLTGCAGLVWPDQAQAVDGQYRQLVSGTQLGQTFVALEDGLSGVEVYLAPEAGEPPAAGPLLSLHLRAGPHTGEDLATATLPAASVVQPGFYRFGFAPQANAQRQDYYAVLEIESGAHVLVGTGPGAAYWSGALYQDGEPAEAQLTFRLVYAPLPAAWGILGGVLRWAAWLLAAALLVVVPGWVLLAWLWPASEALSWGERLGLAAAIGCALYPILFLWTDLVGLHLGPLYAWLPLAAGLAGAGALGWRSWPRLRGSLSRAGRRAWWASGCGWPDLAFVAVMGAVFVTRWWVARPLDLPLWGDSVHHTMIVQLLLDHGGLFSRWSPYAELETLNYHFGFHALAAGFHWLTGLDAPQATLWMAQIVNGLAVLVLYPLGVRVSGSRWGGVAAVLVAGLVSPHPNYYTNWGRYTQVAGQVLLPAAVYFTWALSEARTRRRGVVALGIVVLAGLALTHYRVLLMYVMFLPALLLMEWREARRLAWPLLALGVGSIALALPWLLTTLGEPLLAFVGAVATRPPGSVGSAISDYNSLPDLRLYPWVFWLVAALGLLGGLLQRTRATAVVLLWWVLLVVLANPAVLGLPGTGLVNNFAIVIAAYIGAGLLAAAGAAWLSARRVRRWWPVLAALALALSAWGVRQRTQAVEAGRFMLAGRPDQRAAAWIDSHLPAGARLLVNTFFAYSGTVAVGGDGGWWLPLLAHRSVTLPPITYAMERGPSPDYRQWVEALPAAIIQRGLDDPDVLAMLAAHGVTHVYVGQQRTQTDGGPRLPLQPDDLLASSYYRPVYHEDRVWVFEVLYP